MFLASTAPEFSQAPEERHVVSLTTSCGVPLMPTITCRASYGGSPLGTRAGPAAPTDSILPTSTPSTSRYTNSSALKAWFCVETASFPSTANSLRNASIFGSAGSIFSRAPICGTDATWSRLKCSDRPRGWGHPAHLVGSRAYKSWSWRRALNAWFCVEDDTLPLTAKSVQDASILLSPFRRSYRERM